MILEKIQEIKSEHPLWGYRRVWAYIRYRHNITVNKKRIYRVMKERNLLVSRMRKLKAIRTPQRSKPRAVRPNQFWGIDMTKIMIPSYGWLYLVVVLDWFTKKIVGYSLRTRSKARDWLDALNMAVLNQFPQGIRDAQAKPCLISDNGSQPTSEIFMKECSLLGITQIFASYNNPKGNADTERVMRTIKEDLVWPREWMSCGEFETALHIWVPNYNTDYPHSSIGYLTPQQFEAISMNSGAFILNSFASR